MVAWSAAMPAGADVTVDERTDVRGPLGKLAKFAIETRMSISGDKARIESRTLCGNVLMKLFCPGEQVQIIRLDRDLAYQIEPRKKTYYEENFAEFRARQKATTAQMRRAQSLQSPGAPDSERCEWLPPKADVKRTGEKAQIAGFEAERTTIAVVQPCRVRQTGSVCEVKWVADQWLTAADVGARARQSFWQAYTRKVMLEAGAFGAAPLQAAAYTERYAGVFAELQKKQRQLKGSPVRMTMQLSTGGPQCHDSATAEAGGATDGSTGERPATLGGTVATLGEGLGNLLGRRKKERADEPATGDAAPAVASPGADYALLVEITVETRSVLLAGVEAERFEVPPGFRKIAPPEIPAAP
jgi:hypothetical protein